MEENLRNRAHTSELKHVPGKQQNAMAHPNGVLLPWNLNNFSEQALTPQGILGQEFFADEDGTHEKYFADIGSQNLGLLPSRVNQHLLPWRRFDTHSKRRHCCSSVLDLPTWATSSRIWDGMHRTHRPGTYGPCHTLPNAIRNIGNRYMLENSKSEDFLLSFESGDAFRGFSR